METRANIIFDADLVKEVQQLTALKTRKEVVYFALRELLKQYRRRKLLDLRRLGLWEEELAKLRGASIQ